MFSSLESHLPAATTPFHDYAGPERRSASALAWRWLAAALEEIDYGLVLVGDGAQVLHVNHIARAEVDTAHPLQLRGRELHARQPRDASALRAALDGARRGLRKMLTLGDDAQAVTVSVVPLGQVGPEGGGATLVMLGKRQMCGELAVQGFARGHRLTAGEARVLAALCRGVPPTQIAEQHDVKISTVRTQIGSIRTKTCAASIRDLVRRVAALPPLMTVLRAGTLRDPACNDGHALSA